MVVQIPDKPKKRDYTDMRDFLRASAAWAEVYNQWPWGGSKDEDDEYYFEVTDLNQQITNKEM